MTMPQTPSLTLGPLLYYWLQPIWSDFYAHIADEVDVDRVVIGEVVCSKRLPLYEDAIPAAIDRLKRGGKKVVLASQALVTTTREQRIATELVASGEYPVEINDLTLLYDMPPGRRFSVGPLVNVYNGSTLRELTARGAERICLPPELPCPSIAALAQEAAPQSCAIEVWAFGRAPLAISARCYHARVHGLGRDSCRFVCGEDRDGLSLRTLDGEDFLTINGVQTQSYTLVEALDHADTLREAGVSSFRLSPQSCDMAAVAGVFRDRLAGRVDVAQARQRLATIAPFAPLSNGALAGRAGAVLADA